jgi:hypothetical protein
MKTLALVVALTASLSIPALADTVSGSAPLQNVTLDAKPNDTCVLVVQHDKVQVFGGCMFEAGQIGSSSDQTFGSMPLNIPQVWSGHILQDGLQTLPDSNN